LNGRVRRLRVLVFVLSLGFFITPALLGGGRVIMVVHADRAAGARIRSNWPFAAALSTVLLVFDASPSTR
jgi:ABC-type spermidine/putrescine transport system permease subunit I